MTSGNNGNIKESEHENMKALMKETRISESEQLRLIGYMHGAKEMDNRKIVYLIADILFYCYCDLDFDSDRMASEIIEMFNNGISV